MRPRWLKKRDGRRAPFDHRKLQHSLEAAANAAGEVLMIDELVEVISLLLGKEFSEAVPTADDLQDLVETVLLSTQHSFTAAVYAERRRDRARSRDELKVVRSYEPLLAEDGELPAELGTEAWNEGRIVRALQRQCGMAVELCEEIGEAVEARVFALGFKRVTTDLIRELVQAELVDRGFSARLGRHGPRPCSG